MILTSGAGRVWMQFNAHHSSFLLFDGKKITTSHDMGLPRRELAGAEAGSKRSMGNDSCCQWFCKHGVEKVWASLGRVKANQDKGLCAWFNARFNNFLSLRCAGKRSPEGPMSCFLFVSEHFTDDMGLMHFSVLFHYFTDMGVAVFRVCPTTPTSSAGITKKRICHGLCRSIVSMKHDFLPSGQI